MLNISLSGMNLNAFFLQRTSFLDHWCRQFLATNTTKLLKVYYYFNNKEAFRSSICQTQTQISALFLDIYLHVVIQCIYACKLPLQHYNNNNKSQQ